MLSVSTWGGGFEVFLPLPRIVRIVESLPEEALLRPGRFEWTGKNGLVTYLGANTASHYRFAVKVLKRWQGSKPVRREDPEAS